MKKLFTGISIIGLLCMMTACSEKHDETTMRSNSNRIHATNHAESVVREFVYQKNPELNPLADDVFVVNIAYCEEDNEGGPRLSAHVLVNSKILDEESWPDWKDDKNPPASACFYRKVHVFVPVEDEHPKVLEWYKNNLY